MHRLRLMVGMLFAVALGCGASSSAPQNSVLSDRTTANESNGQIKLRIQQLDSLDVQQRSVAFLAFSKDGRYLACAGNNVTVWDMQDMTLQQQLADHHPTFERRYAAFKPGSLDLVVASAGHVVEWKHQDDKWVCPTKDDQKHRQVIGWRARSIAYSLDGKLLAIGMKPTDGYLIDGPVPSTLCLIRPTGDQVELSPATAKDVDLDEITSVAFSPNGRLLAAGGQEYKTNRSGWVRLIDTSGFELCSKLLIKEGIVRCVAFSSDGDTLAVAIQRTTPYDPAKGEPSVFFFDANEGVQRGALPEEFGAVNSLAYSADGRLLATGKPDGQVRLWEVRTGMELVSYPAHAGRADVVAFSPEGKLLASGGADGRICLWKID